MFNKFTNRFNLIGAATFAVIALTVFGLTAVSAAEATSPAMPHAPVVTIKAHPKHVKVGESSTIIWSAQFATRGCIQAGDWSGQNEGNGGTFVTGPLTAGQHVYTLLCSGGQNRQGSGSVTVTADNKKELKGTANSKPVCEYARPPAGCQWEGMKPFPYCNAAHLVCGLPTTN